GQPAQHAAFAVGIEVHLHRFLPELVYGAGHQLSDWLLIFTTCSPRINAEQKMRESAIKLHKK
ncbi:hypothetical protein, partial [Vibrio diabolicus]|uniref:hypothetical protein n=1 Tax=Vibrio diabolicus TaxID=50719 RepID=UPI00211ABAE5|nr:hypothetical protein [Vibrio diabolicus]